MAPTMPGPPPSARRSSPFPRLFLVALAGYGVAAIGLPALALQWANLGLWRSGRRGERVLSLTFDDGPDPRTTPAILDALREAGMRASFFVMLEGAARHPELLARIQAEGHAVEAHAARHVHAWIRTPWGGFLDPLRAVRGLRALGVPVRFHRPPHGAYTLWTRLGQRRAGAQGAHWSLEAGDWRPGQTPQELTRSILARVVPGDVIVLHDAGPGARVTVPALPGLLRELQARGYRSVPLHELPGAGPQGWGDLRRRLFIALDHTFDRLGGVRFTGGRADHLFRLARVPFPLDEARLRGGQVVRRGVPTLEFHVSNPLIVDLGPRAAVRHARQEAFPDVARELLARPEWADVEAVFCLSSLSPLLGLTGFENLPLGEAQTRRLRPWANVLRWAYGSPTQAGAPELSILSRAEFLARYGGERG